MKQKIVSDLPKTWIAGSMYWPVVLAFNFRVVSVANRPMMGALLGSFWSIYMAHQANKNEKEIVTAKEADQPQIVR